MYRGFPLSHKNYEEAVKLLKERYGNKQLIISTHMNNLIKLVKIISYNVTIFRHLYDKLYRVTSFVLRFISNLKAELKKG